MSAEDSHRLIIGIIVSLNILCGFLSSVDAIMKARTTEGAIAWAISLNTFPYIAVPLYWIFGRNKMQGYVDARSCEDRRIFDIVAELDEQLRQQGMTVSSENAGNRVMELLSRTPFTRYNAATLLIDGKQTFDAIFEGIERARQYVLIQFFIVSDDRLGHELKSKLIRKAREGVRIYFLYDEIGSYGLSEDYIEELEAAGVEIHPFESVKRWYKYKRFYLNFRNHRKIVVIDGIEAYIGGHNVGDEYLGYDSDIGNWRDTHVRIEGPAVQCVQIAFLEDWYWTAHTVPQLCRIPRKAGDQDKKVMVIASGPADRFETCCLFFVHAINSAKHRLWITSPYFVPDSQVVSALQLAALRGVDVRIMLPEKPDHLLVYLSSFSHIAETEESGVKVYRYQPGFLHQKVMLIDDDRAVVGTANLDNRSFRLNFEITLLFEDADFAGDVRKMLERDFSQCRQTTAAEFESRPFWFRLAVQSARLMSPIL